MEIPTGSAVRCDHLYRLKGDRLRRQTRLQDSLHAYTKPFLANVGTPILLGDLSPMVSAQTTHWQQHMFVEPVANGLRETLIATINRPANLRLCRNSCQHCKRSDREFSDLTAQLRRKPFVGLIRWPTARLYVIGSRVGRRLATRPSSLAGEWPSLFRKCEVQPVYRAFQKFGPRAEERAAPAENPLADPLQIEQQPPVNQMSRVIEAAVIAKQSSTWELTDDERRWHPRISCDRTRHIDGRAIIAAAICIARTHQRSEVVATGRSMHADRAQGIREYGGSFARIGEFRLDACERTDGPPWFVGCQRKPRRSNRRGQEARIEFQKTVEIRLRFPASALHLSQQCTLEKQRRRRTAYAFRHFPGGFRNFQLAGDALRRLWRSIFQIRRETVL